MNPLPASYAGAGQPATYATGQATAAPQQSLNEKLQILANAARNLSGVAFDIGMRLGALQPVPSSASAKPMIDNPHVSIAVNDLDAALTQLTDDLQRIRSFVG